MVVVAVIDGLVVNVVVVLGVVVCELVDVIVGV
jgi:hypothetical protein